VAQGAGPEFKPQYHKKKKTTLTMTRLSVTSVGKPQTCAKADIDSLIRSIRQLTISLLNPIVFRSCTSSTEPKTLMSILNKLFYKVRNPLLLADQGLITFKHKGITVHIHNGILCSHEEE
jgi:hypothetical protein